MTEGALVGQGEATQLATIQQVNPLYVNLTQSSSDIMRMREVPGIDVPGNGRVEMKPGDVIIIPEAWF